MTAQPYAMEKIRAGFDRIDADGDGTLTEHDHVLQGQRVATALGHASGSAQLRQAYHDCFTSNDPTAHGSWAFGRPKATA
ncbi:hypothetical protein [Streptomyces sp. 4F14]|uniref:hypothetical protein n=1 Tax=Streptomyces sp. 4F14 TaxID=3394380 RepID=UPI003A88A534